MCERKGNHVHSRVAERVEVLAGGFRDGVVAARDEERGERVPVERVGLREPGESEPGGGHVDLCGRLVPAEAGLDARAPGEQVDLDVPLVHLITEDRNQTAE